MTAINALEINALAAINATENNASEINALAETNTVSQKILHRRQCCGVGTFYSLLSGSGSPKSPS